jgi:hypothetical protein
MAIGTITEKTETLVLAGNSNGLTIFPSPTSLTRLNYFDGKFLRAADLELEQRYMRQLVALSNQAGCAGVVHGFSVTLGDGDALQIGDGLAIDAAGNVLLMPRSVSVAVAELLETSRRSGAGLSAARNSLDKRAARDEILSERARFADCEPRASVPPDQVLEATTFYLIVACRAEAFCGEEDVYGKLCEEACITSTDRPYVVEGVTFRAVPLQLESHLKTSSAVALTGKHLRSRVASAFFADEWAEVAHLISRTGLESDAWCLGAEVQSGACVPIALLAVAGSQTVFLDAWTARRERMESPPRKYWYGRMAMRPWNVFLAQVLQFQCQLRDCVRDLGDPGGEDPCAEAYELLRKTSQTLAGMLDKGGDTRSEGPSTDDVVTSVRTPARFADLSQLQHVQSELAIAARGFFLAPRDRLLINCGIVETPAGGYLPVVPGSEVTVNQQVRRWMGEGVDLRFCVVRPDYVPHALEEVQHMERICLLKGLDNPDDLEEVDVLVPDGDIVSRGLEAGTSFRAVVRIGANPKTAITLQGVARGLRSDGGGVEFHAAGVAEAVSLGMDTTRTDTGNVRTDPRVGPGVGDAGIDVESAVDLSEEFELSLRTIAAEARTFASAVRSNRVAVSRGWSQPSEMRVFTPRVAEPKVAAGWLSLRIDADPFRLSIGDTVAGGVRAVAFLPTRQLSELQVNSAAFTLGDLQLLGARRVAIGQLVVGGITRTWTPTGGWKEEHFNATLITHIERDRLPSGTEVLRVAFPEEKEGPQFSLAAGGNPLTMRAEIFSERGGQGNEIVRFADAGFLESADVLDPSNRLHVFANNALDVLEAGLQESGFAERGRDALFPRPPADTDLDILARLDWVFFHRRRTKICALEDRPVRPPPEPVQVSCQEVWRFEGTEERFKQLLVALQGGNAVNVLREFEATKLGDVEFVKGTDDVFLSSTDPIVAAWSGGTVRRMALIAEPEDAANPAADPDIQLYRNQALKIAQAIPPLAGGLQTLFVDPEAMESSCPAITVLGTEVEVATVCNEVFAIPALLSVPNFDKVVETVKASGLSSEVLIEFKLQSLGRVIFEGNTDQVADDSLAVVTEKWADLDLDTTPANVEARTISISAPGASADEQEAHPKQSTRLRDALEGTADVVRVTSVSAAFESSCSAVTLAIAVRGPN